MLEVGLSGEDYSSGKPLQIIPNYLGEDVSADQIDRQKDVVLMSEQAEQLLKEKNKLRRAVFENVKRIFRESGDFSGTGFFVDSNNNLSNTQKIEVLSEVDEYLFCDDIFRKIYKICFGDLDDKEEVSKHIMARVLGGESINQNLEGDREFIYDDRDERVEKLLKNLEGVYNLDGLQKRKQLLDEKYVEISSKTSFFDDGSNNSLNNDISPTVH